MKADVCLNYKRAVFDFYVRFSITLFSFSQWHISLAVSPGLSHNDQPETSTVPSGRVSGRKYIKNIYQFMHFIPKA